MIRRPTTFWLAVVCVSYAAATAAQSSTPAQPSSSAPPPQSPAVQEAGGRLITTYETVVVRGDPDAPVENSSLATKVETPLIETPRSVSVLDRGTLDDMSAVNITQAHDYTVGLTPADERGPGFARGFPVDFYDLRRDGLRTYSWSVREPAALDRIQYLHGSASVLYGDGSPGALVNLVIKKPLPQRHLEFSASGGSAGFGRVTADATGPLNAARTIRYRVIGAGEWLENGFDNGERRLTFFPSLAIDLSPGVTLSVDAEFYHQRGRNYRHAVPATPATERGDFSKFPWDVSMGSPTDGWTGDNIAPGVRLDARLGATSSLHASARYTGIGGNLNLEALTGLSPDGQSALRYHYREISHWNEYQSDTFATSVVHTGAIAHTLVAGVEGGLSTTHSQIGFGDSAPLDLANPDYGPPPSPPPLSPTRFDVTRVGLYASDQMRLGPQVIVVPGVRWSRVGIDDKVAAKTTVDSLATPSLGVVVLPRAWFSIYANYFEGFEPPSPGENLESGGAPALAKNWSFESGAKFDLFGRRLTATAAAFHIRRTNIPEANERGLYQQIGEGTSHGLEFEAVGHISVGLTTRAGYAWTATKVTSDVSSAAIGNELPNAPHQKAEVWTRYRLPADVARGVMMAAGVVYEGERFTDAANTVTAPAYTRFDASSSWELPGRRHLTLGLAAENLTNRRYVRSGAGAVFFAGPPRRVALQLTSVF